MTTPSRLFFFGGAAMFAIVSILPWYQQRWGAENAWRGELSLGAGAAMIGSVILNLAGRGRQPRWLWALLELAASAAVATCCYLYIAENREDIYLGGRIIPSGMQVTPYFGLVAGVLMTVGSMLSLRTSKEATGD